MKFAAQGRAYGAGPIEPERAGYVKAVGNLGPRQLTDLVVEYALDALTDHTRYDEFVIASGDSDMTPLLRRLRRADRHTIVMSAADAAAVFTVIADHILDSQQLVALVQGERIELDDEADDETEEAELDARLSPPPSASGPLWLARRNSCSASRPRPPVARQPSQ